MTTAAVCVFSAPGKFICSPYPCSLHCVRLVHAFQGCMWLCMQPRTVFSPFCRRWYVQCIHLLPAYSCGVACCFWQVFRCCMRLHALLHACPFGARVSRAFWECMHAASAVPVLLFWLLGNRRNPVACITRLRAVLVLLLRWTAAHMLSSWGQEERRQGRLSQRQVQDCSSKASSRNNRTSSSSKRTVRRKKEWVWGV